METVHLLIKGRVQGVYYRVSAKEKAEALELRGWVRNTRDGDVEALVSGRGENVQQFIDWCHQGPPGARVTAVIATPAAESDYKEFSILRG